MGVSKNRGTPKWMVYIKMDDLGVPLFLETPLSSPANLTCNWGIPLTRTLAEEWITYMRHGHDQSNP